MSVEQFEQAKREFADKWRRMTHSYSPDAYTREFLSDLTALLEQHKEVMMEFTEWIGENANILYFPNSNDKWLLSRLVKGENPSVEYDEYSTAELLDYWIKNVKKS
jgi:hypothetical protein